MGKRRHKQVLTAVEIGTRWVKVVIGEFQEDGVLNLLGVGEEPSLKVMKGEISDPAVVQEQLQKAMVNAEDAAGGVQIENVFLLVTGSHIGSVNSVGSMVINSDDPHVSEEDREAALQNAWGYTFPPDRATLHHFRRQFTVDGREVDNPVGLFGSKLEADVHIIYGQLNRLQNSRNMIVEAMGAEESEPQELIFSGVAAGLGVFEPEEVEKGAMVIDLGAGVTEVAVFTREDRCLYSGQVTVGCEHLANDLSLGLHLPVQRCREMLETLDAVGAKAVMTQDGNARLLEVDVATGRPPRKVPVSTVEQILELRLQELFSVIRDQLEAKRMLNRIGFGIKLVGGGALIPQVTDLARRVFEMPVSVGVPRLVNGQKEVIASPRFVAPLGALRLGRSMLKAREAEKVGVGGTLRSDLEWVGQLFSKWKRAFPW